jgi:hypothetical protein
MGDHMKSMRSPGRPLLDLDRIEAEQDANRQSHADVTVPNLVVVSYYDRRPATELIALLDQIREIDAGTSFDLCIVVNATDFSTRIDLPNRHNNIEQLFRANQGYNVGAWQHGWLSKPGYDFYLFLQDECVIRRAGWLRAFLRAAGAPRTGLVGESLDPFSSWTAFSRFFPDVFHECRRVAAERHIAMGEIADHLQTLVIGARGDALRRMGGFVLGESKQEAVTGEVLTSVLARAHGYGIRQVAWRPFEYIDHPQWSSLRDLSRRWYWSISRAMHLYLPPGLNAMIPRRRGARTRSYPI